MSRGHLLIEDLKRKDFVASLAFPDREALRPDLPRFIIGHLRSVAPLVDYLCGALELDF